VNSWKGGLVLGVIVLGTLACSPTSVDGTPSASTVAGKATQSPVSGSSFDACKDISGASLTSFGLDPSTKKVSAGQEADLGAGCAWTSQQVTVSFFTTPQTVGDLAARPFLNITRITVESRDSVQFQVDEQRACAVAVPAQSSTVVVNLTINFSSIGSVDPCSAVLAIATELAPTLPR
jgi:hypothetical protein